MPSNLSRREWLTSGIAGSGALIAYGALANNMAHADGIDIAQGTRILFQGDSITDAGRSRQQTGPNQAQALGNGYPMLIAAYLLAKHPAAKLEILNRGISGNKVPDLDRRWKADCLDLKPNVLSILIGVNDIWHKLNGQYDGTVASYEQGFTELLTRTRTELPETCIVICDPFVLRCGAVNDRWFPEFDQRREACRRVADRMECVWVGFQEMFDDAVNEDVRPDYWAGDGVHPTLAGHALMAKTWLESVL